MRWMMTKDASVPALTLWREPKLFWLGLPLVWDEFHLVRCELSPVILLSPSIKGLPWIKEGYHAATLTEVMSSNIIGNYNLIVRSLQNGVLSSYNLWEQIGSFSVVSSLLWDQKFFIDSTFSHNSFKHCTSKIDNDGLQNYICDINPERCF